MPRNRPPTAGFSLVEILIVAVLLAIVTLAAMRVQAMMSSTVSKLENRGQADTLITDAVRGLRREFQRRATGGITALTGQPGQACPGFSVRQRRPDDMTQFRRVEYFTVCEPAAPSLAGIGAQLSPDVACPGSASLRIRRFDPESTGAPTVTRLPGTVGAVAAALCFGFTTDGTNLVEVVVNGGIAYMEKSTPTFIRRRITMRADDIAKEIEVLR